MSERLLAYQPPGVAATNSRLATRHDPHRVGAFYGHAIQGLAPKDAFRIAALELCALAMEVADLVQ